MHTLTFQDKHNDHKQWIVKRYACGHFYMNQTIDGCTFYPRFVRTTRAWLQQISVKF